MADAPEDEHPSPLDDPEVRAAFDRAGELWRQSTALTEGRRYDEAIAAMRETVAIYQRLSYGSSAFAPNFALALVGLTRVYDAAGDPVTAEKVGRQAILAFGRVEPSPDKTLVSHFAKALSHVGGLSYRNGDPETAAALLEQAIAARDWLPEAVQAQHRREQAIDLDTLSNRRSDTGDHRAALPASRRAVELLREVKPDDQNLRSLAIALTNLSNRLRDTGSAGEAVAAGEEALRLYEILSAHGVDVTADRALTTTNLVAGLVDEGRLDEAEAVAITATALNRDLAAADPARYLSELVKALSNHASVLNRLYRFQDSLDLNTEALRLHLDEIAAGRIPGGDFLVVPVFNASNAYLYADDRPRAYQAWHDLLDGLRNGSRFVSATATFASWLILHQDDPTAVAILQETLPVAATDADRAELRHAALMIDPAPADLPDWLTWQIPAAHQEVFDAWAASIDLDGLETFVHTHTDVLTTPDFRKSLATVAQVHQSNTEFRQMLDSLDLFNSVGADEAIERTRSRADRTAVLREWTSLTDPDASRDFLEEHRASLTDPRNLPILRAGDHGMRQHAALLELSESADPAQVYSWMQHPVRARDAALEAIATDDILRLGLLLDLNPRLQREPLVTMIAALIRDDEQLAAGAVAYLARADAATREWAIGHLERFADRNPDIEGAEDALANLRDADVD